LTEFGEKLGGGRVDGVADAVVGHGRDPLGVDVELQAGLREAAPRYAEGRLLADLVADGLPGEDFPGDDLPVADLPPDDLPAADLPADDQAAEPRAGREAERPVPPSSVPA
jgi:hypothetical protein